MCKPNIHNNLGDQVPFKVAFPTGGMFNNYSKRTPPSFGKGEYNIYFIEKINTVKNGYH